MLIPEFLQSFVGKVPFAQNLHSSTSNNHKISPSSLAMLACLEDCHNFFNVTVVSEPPAADEELVVVMMTGDMSSREGVVPSSVISIIKPS